jgi:hypothetical protein
MAAACREGFVAAEAFRIRHMEAEEMLSFGRWLSREPE